MFKLLSSTRAGRPATSVSPSTLAQHGTVTPSQKQDPKKGSLLTRTLGRLKGAVTRARSTEKVSIPPKDADISQNQEVHNQTRQTPKPKEAPLHPAPRRGLASMGQSSTTATSQRPPQTVAPARSIRPTNEVSTTRGHTDVYRRQVIQNGKPRTPKPTEFSPLRQGGRGGPTSTDKPSTLGTSQRPPRAHAPADRYVTPSIPPQHARSSRPRNSDLDRVPANAHREVGVRLIPVPTPPMVDNGEGRRLTAKEQLEISQREFDAEMARQRRYAKALKREHLARTRAQRKAERDGALMRLVDALDPFLQEQEQIASVRELL